MALWVTVKVDDLIFSWLEDCCSGTRRSKKGHTSKFANPPRPICDFKLLDVLKFNQEFNQHQLFPLARHGTRREPSSCASCSWSLN